MQSGMTQTNGSPEFPGRFMGTIVNIIKQCIVIFFLSLTLSGCTLTSLKGVHLHNIEKDKQAQELKTQLSKIRLEQTFNNAGKNLDSILAHEQRIASEVYEMDFRTTLWAIISNNQSLQDLFENDEGLVKQRFDDLSGTSSLSLLKKIPKARSSLKFTANEFTGDKKITAQDINEVIELLQLIAPNNDNWSCKKIESNTVDQITESVKIEHYLRSRFNVAIQRLKKLCAKPKTISLSELLRDFEGVIEKSLHTWIKAEQEANEISNQIKDAREGLKKKAEKEDNELNINTIKTEIEKIVSAVNSADSILDVLGKDKVITEERITAINTLFDAFEAENFEDLDDKGREALEKDPDLHRAAIILAGLPSITGQVQNLVELVNSPAGRAGLAIQAAQLQAKLNYLNKRDNLLKKRAGVALALLDARLQEAEYFLNALKVKGHAKELWNKSWLDIAKVTGSPKKEAAYKAFISIALSQKLAKAKGDLLEYSLIDIEHRNTLLADEFAANSWKILINESVVGISAYHASGIKQETISGLIQSLIGLGLVGVIAAD